MIKAQKQAMKTSFLYRIALWGIMLGSACVMVLSSVPGSIAGLRAFGSTLLPQLAARQSSAFDRQYVIPTPSSSDDKTDWWWFNGQADSGVGGNAPANVQVVFFMGYIFGRSDPSDPEFYISIDGLFPDGTPLHFTLPATGATVTSAGTETYGTWDGAGTFVSAPGRYYDMTFASADITGSISLTVSGAPNHFACNTTTSPFFSSIAPGSLSADDQVLFNNLGWAVSAPAGRVAVSLTVDGTPLMFTGTGYHDQNFISVSDLFGDVITQWFFGTAQVGPYVFSYLETQTFGSSNVVTTGFLARDGVVLQNQCSLASSSSTQPPNTSKLSRFGVIRSEASGVDVPAGYTITYTLSDGEQFIFNLTETTEVLDLPVYHRSIGPVTGGKVGESPSEGVVLFEWLNPGVNVYTPPSS